MSEPSRRPTPPGARALVALAALSTLAALAGLAAGCGRSTAPDPAAAAPAAAHPTGLSLDPAQRQKLRLETVASAPFRRTVETTGTVAFDQNRATQVLSPVSGPVARLAVQLGAEVSRGETLAVVASPDFATDVSALRKAVATARNARRVADLDEQLFKNEAIARRDMEQAQTDAISAEADRDAALEQLHALGVDKTTIADILANRPVSGAGAAIRSPIAGTVVERLITPGQLLQAGTTPCFTVADLSTVWVMANVFESDLPFVAAGDKVEIAAGAGSPPIAGRVDYVGALVDPTTRAIPVRIVAANPGRMLKRDLYVSVAIQSSRAATGLLVPVSAILHDDENLPFVFVASADGTFARRRVETGPRVADRQQITAGLAAGESVVAEGGLYLQAAESQ